MDGQKVLRYGGLGAIAAGLYLWMTGGKAPAPAPAPAPGPVPATATSCAKVGTGRLVRCSWFYNWADLAALPLSVKDKAGRHTWNTGGGTCELGWMPGQIVNWTEAKYGVADNGTTGWFVRVDGGAWALPSADCGVLNPCR